MWPGNTPLTLTGSNTLTYNLIVPGAALVNDGSLTMAPGASLRALSLSGAGSITTTGGDIINIAQGAIPATQTITLDPSSQLFVGGQPTVPPPPLVLPNLAAVGANSQSRYDAALGITPTADVAMVTAQSLGIAPSDPNIGVAYRLYQAALDRAPDQSGLTFWTDGLNQGLAPITEANDFASSAEFLADYGNLTSSDFVSQMYSNVLGRAPDAAGDAFWVGSMNAGLSRASTLLAFANSQENRLNTNTATHETG